MEIARHWRLKKQRYGLVGEVCPHCDHKIFPPRGVCPNCKGETKLTVAPQGKINTYTTVYKPGEEAPLAISFQSSKKQLVTA